VKGYRNREAYRETDSKRRTREGQRQTVREEQETEGGMREREGKQETESERKAREKQRQRQRTKEIE
jgi:hypothetical protein